jgi:hypothetical protein
MTVTYDEDHGAPQGGAISYEPTPGETGHGVWDWAVNGLQQSSGGLFARGRLPDLQLDPSHAPWYDKLSQAAGQTVGDLPASIVGARAFQAVGGLAAAPLGPEAVPFGAAIGGGVGGFAVPTAIRESLVKAYSQGDATSSSDYLDRIGIVMKGLTDKDVLKATGESAVTGGLTMGVGKYTKSLTGSTSAQLLSELGTMTLATDALQGKLPEMSDFVDNALILGGQKFAGHIAMKMGNVFARTGKTPDQVRADAAEDPRILLDLKPVEGPAPKSGEPMIDIFHGSPHEFDQLDADKIGTGEGAQIYGHGLYAADRPVVSGIYKEDIASRIARSKGAQAPAIEGIQWDKTLLQQTPEVRSRLEERGVPSTMDYGKPLSEQDPAALQSLKNKESGADATGHLYRLQVAVSKVKAMLDWDAKASDHPPAMQMAIKKLMAPFVQNGAIKPDEISGMTGKDLTKFLRGQGMSAADVSASMKQAGITGVKYLDHLSRGETPPPVQPDTSGDTPALEQARGNNKFTGQSLGVGRGEGYTQPKGTPPNKLFSNFGDTKLPDYWKRDETGQGRTRKQIEAENEEKFRAGMFDRANTDPSSFKLDPVLTHTEPFGKDQIKVESGKAGRTRVQVIRDGKVIGAARILEGKLDSIAVDQSAKGEGLGAKILQYIDKKGIGNIDEVPDRSPGFIQAQRQAIESRRTRNYVIFDANDARVVERNGIKVGQPDSEIPRAYQDQAAADAANRAMTERPQPPKAPGGQPDPAALEQKARDFQNAARALLNDRSGANEKMGQAFLDRADKLLARAKAIREGTEPPPKPGPAPGDPLPRGASDEARAAQFINDPFKEPEQLPGMPKVDFNPNMDYITDDIIMKGVLAKGAELYRNWILKQTRGRVSMAQTHYEALKIVKEMSGASDFSLLADREIGSADNAAIILARGDLMKAAARDFYEKLSTWDSTSSPHDWLAMTAAAERVGMLTANALGARAEIGRALQIMKDDKSSIEVGKQILELMKNAPDPAALKAAAAQMTDPAAIARLARQAMRPKELSALQKAASVYRSMLLYGPMVMQVKMIGDGIATATNVVERYLAAGIGLMPGVNAEVTFREANAYLSGMARSAKDAITMARENWKDTAAAAAESNQWTGYRNVFGIGPNGEPPSKGSFKANLNKILALPGRAIEAETVFPRVLNESGEASAQAVRRVMMEGKEKPGTKEFDQAVANARDNPTKEESEAIRHAGEYGTYVQKLGEIGQVFQKISQTGIGGFVIPFAKVPSNLTKWSVEHLPVASLMLKEVRDDFAAGGARAQIQAARSIAGFGVMAFANSLANSGILTGNGLTMTPEQRLAKRASGWQPQSIKIGDTYYSYQRFEPVARMLSVVSDWHEMQEHADKDEHANWGAMIASAFGYATISQTYLEGLHGLMEAIDHGDKAGPQYFNQFAAGWIPAFMGQTANAIDPYDRRIDSLFDELQSKIPFLRQGLMPKLNPLSGQPEPNAARIYPVRTSEISNDPVLTEAARLEIGVAREPKSVQLKSSGEREIGKVSLTPEQREEWSSTSGEIAHRALSRIVGTDRWQQLNPLAQEEVYKKALAAAHKVANSQTLSVEQRKAEAARIHEELERKMHP